MTTEVPVSIDLTCVKEWFDYFNARFFSGELNTPVFDIDPDLPTERKWVGYCICEMDGEYILGLTKMFDSSEDFYDTLLHEMIHLYQMQILGEEPNHYISFRYWKKEFLKDGYFV